MKYIASVSFGKDSLAMLLILIEKKYKLDEVIFYDTGMEFKAIYTIRDKVKKILEKENIKYTELKPKQPFLYKMLEKKVNKRDGTIQYGYGLCGGRCRWGTTEKKTTIEKYLKQQYGKDYKEYIGIASDEKARIQKARDEHKLLPLVEWEMTEKDCLEYCYEKGFYWKENEVKLYDILDRVSCWCCTNKNNKELENYKKYLPEYFNKILELTYAVWVNARNDKLKNNTDKFLTRLEKIRFGKNFRK